MAGLVKEKLAATMVYCDTASLYAMGGAHMNIVNYLSKCIETPLFHMLLWRSRLFKLQSPEITNRQVSKEFADNGCVMLQLALVNAATGGQPASQAVEPAKIQRNGRHRRPLETTAMGSALLATLDVAHDSVRFPKPSCVIMAKVILCMILSSTTH